MDARLNQLGAEASTGRYTNGAAPTVPAVTLGGGVNRHSSDVFNLRRHDANNDDYEHESSERDVHDLLDHHNIPGTVGGNRAYVGFTAGTGAAYTQQIGTWTYGP